MSLRKHNPVPIEIMEQKSAICTICETLRQIYHKTDDEEIRLLCRVATSMAKSMSKRLRHYKDNASYSTPEFWERKENGLPKRSDIVQDGVRPS